MKILYTLALLCLFCITHAQPGTWKYVGPNRAYFGGTTNRIGDITFADLQTGYATNLANHEILKTVNGGDSWQIMPCNITGTKAQFISALTGYVSNGYQISKTDDGAGSWQLLLDTSNAVAGNSFTHFTFVNQQRGYVAGNNCVLRTNDGGNTWGDIKPVAADTLWNYLIFLDNNNGWLFGDDSLVWKTTNGGDNWNPVAALPITQHFDIVVAARFFSQTEGIVLTQNGEVFSTYNGGDSWIAKTSLPLSNLVSAKCNADGLLYAQDVSTTGFTIISSDTGSTWQTINNGEYEPSLFFHSPTHGFVTSAHIIHRTTDGVTFQTDSQQFVTPRPMHIIDQLSSTKLVAAYGADYAESDDNGISWTEYPYVSPDYPVCLIKAINANCYYKLTTMTFYRYLNNVETFSDSYYDLVYAGGTDSIIVSTRVGDSIFLLQSINGGSTWSRFAAIRLFNLDRAHHWTIYEPFGDLLYNKFAKFTSWNEGIIATATYQTDLSIEYVTTDHGNTWKLFVRDPNTEGPVTIMNTKAGLDGKTYCLRKGINGKASLHVYNTVLQDWTFINILNYGSCLGNAAPTILMDFDWSADGTMWATLCNGSNNTMHYSLDNGLSWNDTYQNMNYVTCINQTYTGRLFAGTKQGEILEYSGVLNSSRIKGNVYYDFNRNSVKDGYDVDAPNRTIISTAQGNSVAVTTAEGNYTVIADVGTNTIKPQATVNYAAQPTVRTINLSQPNTISTGNDFALQPIDTSIADLQIGIIAGVNAAPGFAHSATLFCSNNGVKPLNPVVTYILDQVLIFDSASPAPSSQSGDTLRWILPTLTPFQSTQINLKTRLVTTAVAGNFVNHFAAVNPITGDYTPQNNIASARRIITASLDPNVKEVFPDSIPVNQSQSTSLLTYTVHFQNTGTGPAHFVIIKDRLSPKLNCSSLRVVAASHAYRYHIEHENLLVVTFDNIMLPDSNANEAESHGFVTFTINPAEEYISSSSINNYADIYFDYNSPITTNTSKVTVSSDLNTSIKAINEQRLNIAVFPNPTNRLVNLKAEQDFSCTLRDIWGREIMQGISTNGTMQFAVDGLSAGLYYLQVNQNGITEAYSLSVMNR